MKKKIQEYEARLWKDIKRYESMFGKDEKITRDAVLKWMAIRELMRKLDIEEDIGLLIKSVTLN